MLNKTLLTAAVIGLTSASLTANASDYNGYLFGSFGKADHRISSSDRNAVAQELADFVYGEDATGASTRDRQNAWKVGAGVRVHENVAVEFQYLDLGEARIRSTSPAGNSSFGIDTRGLGASVVGILPVEQFEFFGKLGYHQLKSKYRIRSDIGSASDGSDKEWVTGLGLGVAFNLNPDFALVAEYERYRNVADEYNVDLMSVGLRYKF